MTPIAHPSEILQPAWTQTIRNNAAQAEQDKQLTREQLGLLYRQKWFTLLVPQTYGGLEWPLPQVVRFEEAIAWADGSVAWVLTLCAGAGWFGGFLQPPLAQQLFANPEVCLAGSGAATGTAEITGNGYCINGNWLHASGSPHATVFTANCVITRNGQPVLNDEGAQLIKPFALLKQEVQLQPTWQSFGLIATASNAFAARDVVVPEHRCFAIDKTAAVVSSPLYQYPFLQLAEATLAANNCGMALHFVDEARSLLQNSNKPRDITEPLLQQSYDTLQQQRASFYQSLDSSWQQQVQQGFIDAATLHAVSSTSRRLAQQSRQVVDELYPYCGLQAAATGSSINRVWRDLHTASQHSLLVYPR
jgi:alkylation response protein AidB-like acyl-CoA dehydrogenase